MWVNKGRWLYFSTLDTIKHKTKALCVHYTPDPAFTVHTSRHFARCLSLYDLCVTTKRYELEKYRRAGAKNVVFTWQGIDDRFARLPECTEISTKRREGAIFIGHREAHYQSILTDVASAGIKLGVYGPGWHKMLLPSSQLRHAFRGGPVWGDAYVRTLASGKVGLGLLSKLYPDQYTTRTFEISAAGTMLLAERTPEHQELFEEGKEAQFFADTTELVDKLRFYLAHNTERIAIAEAGRKRALQQYGWEHFLRPALDFVIMAL